MGWIASVAVLLIASVTMGQVGRPQAPRGPATRPATAPVVPVPILSFLRGLPVNSRPNLKTGWDEFSRKHASDWFTAQAPGARVYVVATVNGGGPEGKQPMVWVWPDGQRWRVEVSVGPTTATLFGGSATLQSIFDTGRGEPSSTLAIIGDEAFAKRAKTWKAGRKLSITGTLTGVGFDFRPDARGGARGRQSYRLALRDWVVEP